MPTALKKPCARTPGQTLSERRRTQSERDAEEDERRQRAENPVAEAEDDAR